MTDRSKAPSRRGIAAGVALAALVPVVLVALFKLMPEPRDDGPVAHEAGRDAGPDAPEPSAVAATAGPRDAAPTARAEGALVLRGRVRSSVGGEGVPSPTLVFLRDGTTSMARGDADGAFEFRPEQPGRWALASLTADGYTPYSPEVGHSSLVFVIEPNARADEATLVLSPLTEFDGTVLSASGAPVAGAEVRVETPDGSPLSGAPAADRTDASGHVRVRAPERSTVVVRHPEHGPGRALLDERAWVTRRFVVRLEAPVAGYGALEGVVVDPRGEPIDGARVLAMLRDRAMFREGQTTTGANGRFRLEGLTPGAYLVEGQHEGHLAMLAGARVEPGATAEVRVQLGAEASVRGRVRDRSNGAAVQSFTVLGTPLSSSWAGAPVVASVHSADGAYWLRGLPAGPVEVRVESSEFATSEPQRATLTEGAEASLDFALDGGGTVQGRVVAEGAQTPIAGAQVTLDESTRSRGASAFTTGNNGTPERSPLAARARAVTGADGAFTLAHVPAGVRSLRVIAAGHHSRAAGGVRVESGQTAQVTVTLRPIAGDERPVTDVDTVPMRLGPGTSMRVQSVAPELAASGLRPGDTIVAVDGHDATTTEREELLERLRGEPGTSVRVTVQRTGAAGPIVLEVPRARGRLNQSFGPSAMPSAQPSAGASAPPAATDAPRAPSAPSAEGTAR